MSKVKRPEPPPEVEFVEEEVVLPEPKKEAATEADQGFTHEDARALAAVYAQGNKNQG